MDEKNTSEVFEKLGFKITVTKDLTVSQMKNLLTKGLLALHRATPHL